MSKEHKTVHELVQALIDRYIGEQEAVGNLPEPKIPHRNRRKLDRILAGKDRI